MYFIILSLSLSLSVSLSLSISLSIYINRSIYIYICIYDIQRPLGHHIRQSFAIAISKTHS